MQMLIRGFQCDLFANTKTNLIYFGIFVIFIAHILPCKMTLSVYDVLYYLWHIVHLLVNRLRGKLIPPFVRPLFDAREIPVSEFPYFFSDCLK